MDVKDSDVISGRFYNKLIKDYKLYDAKQKAVIYELSNEVYDLKELLKLKDAEIKEYTDTLDYPVIIEILSILQKYCNPSTVIQIGKWFKTVKRAETYKLEMIRAQRKIAELRKEINQLKCDSIQSGEKLSE